jgi:hypothetical protein
MVETEQGEFVAALIRRREEVRDEIAKTDEERAYLRSEYMRRDGQLQHKTEVLEAEVKHIEELLKLRNALPSADAQPEGSPARMGSDNVGDAAYEILRSEGRGLHYSELLARLNSSGILVRGRNPGATLVSRLIRDRRFARPERRGVYALREWNPTASDVGARKRTRRRRSRAKVRGQGSA